MVRYSFFGGIGLISMMWGVSRFRVISWLIQTNCKQFEIGSSNELRNLQRGFSFLFVSFSPILDEESVVSFNPLCRTQRINQEIAWFTTGGWICYACQTLFCCTVSSSYSLPLFPLTKHLWAVSISWIVLRYAVTSDYICVLSLEMATYYFYYSFCLENCYNLIRSVFLVSCLLIH